MRGFRGSRAAKNVMSFRYGTNHQQLPQRGEQATGHQPEGHSAVQQPAKIPDWLKTPETRAKEAAAAAAAAPQARAAPQPRLQAPRLRAIPGGQPASRAPRTKPTPPRPRAATSTRKKVA